MDEFLHDIFNGTGDGNYSVDLLLDNEVRDERWIMPRTTSRASFSLHGLVFFFLQGEGKRMACDDVDARTHWSVSIT